MASRILVALLVLGTAASASAQGLGIQTVGGTDTIRQMLDQMLIRFQQLPGTYRVAGSSGGIAAFNGGLFNLAFSDMPMNGTQEYAFNSVSQKYGKLTLPLVVSTYGFFVSANPANNIKLTALQTYTIYTKGGTWKQNGNQLQIPGPITRFAQGNKCGANYIIKSYWKAAVPNNPVVPDDAVWDFPQLTYITGVQTMCQELTDKAGGIAYSMTGICTQYVKSGQITEVFMQEGNGGWIKPSLSKPLAAIPANLPPANQAWEGIPDQMLLSKAKWAPPIVVFTYTFVRQRGLAYSMAHAGPTTRRFLLFALKMSPVMAKDFGYYPVPSTLYLQNLAALHTLKMF